MAALSTFYPYILPYCPGAPEPAIDQALVDVADDFCRRSLAMREELEPIRVRVGDFLFDVEPADSAQLVAEVIDAAFLEGAREHSLDPGRPEKRNPTDEGIPAEYWQPRPEQLRINCKASVPGTLQLTVATKPKPGATALDDRLFNEWRTVIAAGVLVRMYLTPGQAYSSPEAAGSYQSIFEAGVNSAHGQAQQGNVRARLRVIAHP